MISLMILSRGDDLICTTLIKALKDNIEIGVIQHFSSFEMAARMSDDVDVAIIFPDLPISYSASNITRLTEKGIKILLILGSGNKYSIRCFAKLPIHGFISMQSTYDELIAAVKTLKANQQKYISPRLLLSINDVTGDNVFASLSKKETDVVEMTISGKKCRDIANLLKISPKTVSTYKARIYKKLEVNNDVELYKLALIHDIENAQVNIYTDQNNNQ